MTETVDVILKLSERLGFPAAFCLVILLIFWRVCKFLSPLVKDWFAGQQTLMSVLAANDQKHAEGHTTTHQKIDGLARDVTDVKAEVKVIRTRLEPRIE